MILCWAAFSAFYALLSSHMSDDMTNTVDNDDNGDEVQL